jgi:hypothetical protein
VKQIKINRQGLYDLAIGDFDNNLEDEIILAPRFVSKDYLYIYNLSGNLIKTYSKDVSHQGAILDFHNGQIVLAYLNNDQTNLEILDSNLRITNYFHTSNIWASEVKAYDLDNDGQDDYIFIAKAGTAPWLKVFDKNGIEKFGFRVYPTRYKAGFHFYLADYNHDNQLEFVFTPTEDTTPLRVMSLQGTVITERFPFSGQNFANVFSLLSK